MNMHRGALLAFALVCAPLPAQGSVWAKLAPPTILQPGGGVTPQVCLAFDGVRGIALYTVLIGYDLYTVEWDGSAWTPRASLRLSTMREFRFVYDTARSVFVGVTQNGSPPKTYQWNATSSTWGLLGAAFPGTGARDGFCLGYDTKRGRTVLFGGGNGTLQAETYEFDGATWQLRGTGGPVPRMNAPMAFDTVRNKLVLYGGETSIGTTVILADTWEWNGLYWQEALGATAPGVRKSAGLAFDPALGKSVLVGGQTWGGGAPTGTWEWDGSTWNGDLASTQPVGAQGTVAGVRHGARTPAPRRRLPELDRGLGLRVLAALPGGQLAAGLDRVRGRVRG